jgi:hypothetical protein
MANNSTLPGSFAFGLINQDGTIFSSLKMAPLGQALTQTGFSQCPQQRPENKSRIRKAPFPIIDRHHFSVPVQARSNPTATLQLDSHSFCFDQNKRVLGHYASPQIF